MVLVALLAAVASLAGCRGIAPEVKVGLVGPFEGKDRSIGYDVIYSARLAIRQVNEAGGIGRYRIGLVALDDFGDPEIGEKAADALIIDPQIVAVIGHWTEATTAAAEPRYTAAGMPFLAGGRPPLARTSPETLPQWFRQIYGETTPFDEEAGPYAGPAYDGMNLLFAAMAQALAEEGTIDRESVGAALESASHEGVTGRVRAR